MNYEIILATNNQAKVKEFRDFFSGYTLTFLTLEDIKLKLAINETGHTFLENAMIKVKTVSKHVNKTIVSDDSGLQVDALKGFPGVYSSRWLQDKTYEEKNAEILRLMDIHKNRRAQFSCAIVIHYPHKEMRFFVGTTSGKITKSIESGSYGFGYDPIFYSDDLAKTFSQATLQEKSSISHRGRACEKLLQCLLDKKLITKVKKR
jgi:XTP/dITP diphosphohydrolase